MNVYLIYLMVWLVFVLILSILLKYLPAKMKLVEDPKTRNSLFTILMITGIPLIMIIIIAPILVLAGDENMPSGYKYFFVFIVFFILVMYKLLKRKKPEGTNGKI